jgi:hypothetical protein
MSFLKENYMLSSDQDNLMGRDQFQITLENHRSSLLRLKQTVIMVLSREVCVLFKYKISIPKQEFHPSVTVRPGMRKSCKVACRGDKINTLSAPEIFSLGGARWQFIITFCEDNRWPASHGHRAGGCGASRAYIGARCK